MLAGMEARLLAWYARHSRPLPWRRTRDPYAIWVSEVMLQQTRVETVLAYYTAFLDTFPSLEHLAASDLPAVLKAWEGMGYYRRARNLHRAAREALARHGGFPPDHDALLALPGVGKYTAAAVRAIAFGEPHLPIDGNIRRVLSRVFDLDTLRERIYREVGEPLLADLTPRKVASMVQALMELGALVCHPRNPDCPKCPVARSCRSRRAGTIDGRPPRRPKKPIPHYAVVIAYLRDPGGKVLLTQRAEEGFLGGMWELPGGKVEGEETLEAAIRRELREELGICHLRHLRSIGQVRHAYTHFKVTLHLFEAETGERLKKLHGPVAARWVAPGSIADFPMPRGTQKALMLRDDG